MNEKRLSKHIPVLDGLRGLAILAVIVCHVNWGYGGPWTLGRVNGPVAMIFGWGWVGVDLFFVLSGFLITGILYDAKKCSGYLRNFYARRILRIMPLYFAFLLFVVVLTRLNWLPRLSISLDDLIWLTTYTYNIRAGLTGQTTPGMHHFWSLSVEEHFYLLWPLIVAAADRARLMRLCLAVATASLLLRVAIVLSGAQPMAAFYLTPCRLDGLLAGSFVALAWKDKHDWEVIHRYAFSGATASGLLILCIALGQRHFIPDVDSQLIGKFVAVGGGLVLTVGMAGLAVFFAALVALALEAKEGSWLRRLLENKRLCAVGKYSYAIYVFHALIVILTVDFLPSLSQLPLFVAKLIAVVWVSAASFAVAWLSYHTFERHFLRLKSFFEYEAPAPPDLAITFEAEAIGDA